MLMRFTRLVFVASVVALFAGGSAGAAAQALPAPQPLDLPCTTGISVEILGQAMPPDAGGMALVAARITIAPGGGFAAHTHPGTLTVWIDAGSFGITQLDDMAMTVNRAPQAGTPAASEPVSPNTEVVLGPGDWFVEPGGMVHEAWNRGNDPVTVILSGLVDPAKPLVECVDA